MMNNADFLSDAVALDLGKSGVKVAETLEIQVGEEWWRLINAADVSTVRAYQGRRVSEPVVVGGEIHLDGLTEYRGAVLPPYEGWVNQKHSAIGKDAHNNLLYGVLGQNQAVNYCNQGKEPVFRLYDSEGNLIGNHHLVGELFFYKYHFLFWDSVNSRFVVCSRENDTSEWSYVSGYEAAMDGSSFSRVLYSYANRGAPVKAVKTFYEPEVAGYVYSLFLLSGVWYIKETQIQQGVTVANLLTAVYSHTDSVAVSLVQNTTEPFMFYSRGFGSVGIMWRDSSLGGMKYILKNEGWTTAHDLMDFGGGAKQIFSFGNFVIPNEGEFLIAGISDIPSGVLQRPSGWSYPENMVLIGSGETADGVGVLLGAVGTSLYRIEIDTTTKTITNVSTFALPYDPNNPAARLHLYYASETQEIWVVEPIVRAVVPNRTAIQTGIFCLNLSNNTVNWYFGANEIKNNTIWGFYIGTVTELFSGFVRLGSDKLLFRLQVYKYPNYRYSYFVLPISTALQCTTTAALLTALTESGVKLYTNILPELREPHYGLTTNNGVIYDSVCNHLFNIHYAGSAVTYTAHRMAMANNSLYLPLRDRTLGSGIALYSSSDFSYSAVAHQKYISPGLSETNLDPDSSTTSDGLMAILHSRVKQTSSGAYFASIWAFTRQDGNGDIVSVGRGICGPGSTNALNLRPDTIPLQGDSNARIGFFHYGTTVAADGAHHDAGTNFGGYGQRITVPFTTHIGMACPESGKYLTFSSVVSGDISWAEMDSRCGQPRRYIAYRTTDLTDIYEVTGLDVSGGFPAIHFNGRTITGVTGVGRLSFLDLQADDDDGYASGDGGSYTSIVYDYLDRQFVPYPFAREGIRAELSNISKTTKITLPETQDNLIRGMLAAGTDFRGSRCILRRVFPDHIDEPGSDIVLLDGYIQDWSYVPGKKGIAFSVSKTLIDVGAQFPKRLMNMGCSHVFKGSRCRYLGEEGRCLKTKAFCTSLGNLDQFGGFPWVAARQRRVMWK